MFWLKMAVLFFSTAITAKDALRSTKKYQVVSNVQMLRHCPWKARSTAMKGYNQAFKFHKHSKMTQRTEAKFFWSEGKREKLFVDAEEYRIISHYHSCTAVCPILCSFSWPQTKVLNTIPSQWASILLTLADLRCVDVQLMVRSTTKHYQI